MSISERLDYSLRSADCDGHSRAKQKSADHKHKSDKSDFGSCRKFACSEFNDSVVF